MWFQNRRARTLKCKGAKKALWQSDSPVQDALTPHHVVANRGPQAGTIPLPPQGPPPTLPTKVKEEMEIACYRQCLPAFSTIEERGQYGSMYRFQQGRPRGSSSSTPLRGYWSQPGSQTSSVQPLWCHSPMQTRNYNSTSSQAATFVYPGSAEQQMYVAPSTSHSSTPDTPDSGYWDISLENSPPLQGQYPHLEDSWSGVAGEGCRNSGNLPELSLQEILGELGEDWLGGEGLDSQATGEKMAFC